MSLTGSNEIEKHLLSRCYDSHSEIVELLASRYSMTGDQKPTILFKHIVTNKDKNKRKSLLHVDRNKSTTKITPERKKTTKQELKTYISTTLTNQKKLIKKIQAHNRKQSKTSFPIDKYLVQYRIPKFEDFLTMNELWQKYMQDLIFINGNLPALQMILPRLTAADYNGCLLTVLQSRNTTVVGLRGIVVWDNQHSFIMVVPKNEDSKEWNEDKQQDEEGSRFTPSEMVGGLRVVPKKHTMFGFDVISPQNEDECIGFTIIGSRFEVRSVDRSGKKFKNHSIDDIL
ncbi:POP4 RNases MRP/P 32.9 kDa subunit [Candida maltosa Xu316]